MAKLMSMQRYGSECPPSKEYHSKFEMKSLAVINGDKVNYGTNHCISSSSPSVTENFSNGKIENSTKIPLSPDNNFYSKRPPVHFQWKDIILTADNGQQILKGVSGYVKTGELTAVMGPSGAGKTMLLNVLSGFTCKNVFGQILVNGQELNRTVFSKLSCYIMQDDLVLSRLTVRESIYLAACLKIPSTVSTNDKKRAVDECLESLGLTDRQNNQAYQLSGGQRKRLCIAQQLISNPPFLFLDEPTSGLDSSSCLQCIQLLKSLAEEGRTVVCSIHQPSSRIFQIFDKLYMLADGQCIYRGSTEGLIPFLSEQGLSCPKYHSPTDFVTEIAMGEHGDWNRKLKTAVDGIEDISALNDKSSVFNAINKQEIGLQGSTLFLLKDKTDRKSSIFEGNALYSESTYDGYATSQWYQFKILTHRSLICNLREPLTCSVRLFSHVVIGILLGMLYYGIGNDASKVTYNLGFLFFSLLFLIFTTLMPTVLIFPTEKEIFKREYINGWYSTSAYYLAKSVTEIPFQIIFPLIYCAIVYWMTSQPNDPLRFGIFVLTSIMLSFVAQSIGLLVGAATCVQNAVFLGPAVTVPILLVSGFFISLDSIPFYLQWMSYLSYVRYCYRSVLLGIYSMDRPELQCERSFCSFQDPDEILKEMGMEGGSLYVDYAAMWMFFFVFRIAAYYVLCYRVVYSR